MIETNEDICCHCHGATPEGVMIVVLAAKTGNQYYYCSEECCQADAPHRALIETIEQDVLKHDWPKEI
jgi:hypothetical protein